MNQNKFKILMLSDGQSFHTERFLTGVRQQGYDMKLASLENSPIVDYLLKRKTPISSLHYTLALTQLKNIINEFQPDIINAHFATGYGHLAAQTKADIPIALNLWGSDILIVPQKSFLHKQKAQNALKIASLIFADSQYLLNEANKIVDIKNGHVIPWGIEKKYLALYKNKSGSSHVKIISPRIHKEVYNHLFTVEALKDLIVSGAVELTLPSFGPTVDEFRLTADKLTGGKIKYYDQLDRSDLLEKISAYDIYLSSSKSDSSPVSLIEAMALGLIPVVGKIDGVAEWMNDDSGFLFDLNNSSSLKDAILKIINSDDSFDELRKRNYEKVTQQAIFEDNITSHLMQMEKLIGDRR